MNELTDHELRSRFEQLRAAEAGSAPSFRELLDRANRMPSDANRSAWRWPRRIGIPVALAAAVVLVAGITRAVRRRAAIQAPLSTWTSPTAGLLPTPGIGLYSPAGILTSVLDPATSASVPSKATRR